MQNAYWSTLRKRINNEMTKVQEAKELEEQVTSEAMLAAFSRVLQIMKEMEEK